ncbi:unnamed protein product [Rhizoctonia solani]|uniref:Uncharacterized protein n=2 Tax=Rhizoctonia solani TaxID=456999 RepID=A0A8H3E9N6_9AGAM|nr:unnamed protein product [Rhizoctonia solani]
MEVMDSHMSEHFSAPATTHIDVDMSAEYDDDVEYAMHDITEGTTTNDEEIYDAEFEEVPQHTEIEMDEYGDEVEVVEDDETHMGAYAPTDDGATVTDATVEDLQLRSSPGPVGTPQVVTDPILPHVPVDADLSLNGAPTETLADHSPHSVATLVGDSEVEPLPVDTTKDGTLNEVIDLTENNDEPHTVPADAVDEATSVNPVAPIDQELPHFEHEAGQDDLDQVEQEFYEVEESVVELSSIDPNAPDQLAEPQQVEQPSENTDQDEPATEAPTLLVIPEQIDQGGHSPIEDAIVINQQVRDDAADSMEPSPPIRLYYRDEGKGTDEVFDIFTPFGSDSHETILLFHDNRTLFYEPLSWFFTKLRETEYFSGDEWEGTEMGIRMDLGDSSISINEDHKETENISLFKLSSLWSGLGLDDPLELTLVRRSERFAIQLARLVEQVEQRDFHHEDAAEPPETQHEAETGGPEIGSGDIGTDSDPIPPENSGRENNQRVLINLDEGPGDLPRVQEGGETQAPGTIQPKDLDEQRQGTVGHDQIESTEGIESNPEHEEVAQDNATPDHEPTAQPTDGDYNGTETEDTGPSPQDDDDDDDNDTVSNGQSPSTPTHKPQDDEYDEYEAEEGNSSAAAQTSLQNETSSAGLDVQEYEYEDYEDADEEPNKHISPENAPDEPTDSDRAPATPVAPKLPRHELQSAALKRNLDELEYEEYSTPSAPSSPPSGHQKRVKT